MYGKSCFTHILGSIISYYVHLRFGGTLFFESKRDLIFWLAINRILVFISVLVNNGMLSKLCEGKSLRSQCGFRLKQTDPTAQSSRVFTKNCFQKNDGGCLLLRRISRSPRGPNGYFSRVIYSTTRGMHFTAHIRAKIKETKGTYASASRRLNTDNFHSSSLSMSMRIPLIMKDSLSRWLKEFSSISSFLSTSALLTLTKLSFSNALE